MNLPNKLTLSRMILVPVFMIFASMTPVSYTHLTLPTTPYV